VRFRKGERPYLQSDRLTRVGRPILPSGLSKIESGDRRVDVDDLVGIAAALGVMPDRLLRAPDGSPMDGFPGMTKDDYADSLAAGARFLRQILEKMPAAEREEYEALRRGGQEEEEFLRERPRSSTAMSWPLP
jgi:transcriptional regulator with XRE-family HTH domain